MRLAGMAGLLAGVFLGGAAALASPYSCTIVENGGVLTDVVQFTRSISLSTDGTDYVVQLSDYIGTVKLEIVGKESGQAVLTQEAPSDVPVGGGTPPPFKGLQGEIPGELSVSCQSLSSQ